MRVLVACKTCHRQFDAGGMAVGTRFHCACGKVLQVPKLKAKDAAVVRCSSCGAPRTKDASACKFCEADFTIHEQDLHTICGGCMTRVSDRARFCHRCGAPIVAEGKAGEPTQHPCPACGYGKCLHSRSLGEPPVSMLECGACAGLWLAREAFELVAEHARQDAEQLDGIAQDQHGTKLDRSRKKGRGPMYRPCPRCRQLMNRTNRPRGSGVIVDQCRDHGIWFDVGELDKILRWVRSGGERRDTRRRREQERHAERMKRLMNFRDELQRTDPEPGRYGGWSFLDDLLGAMF